MLRQRDAQHAFRDLPLLGGAASFAEFNKDLVATVGASLRQVDLQRPVAHVLVQVRRIDVFVSTRQYDLNGMDILPGRRRGRSR